MNDNENKMMTVDEDIIVKKMTTTTRNITIGEAITLSFVIIGSGLIFWSNTLSRLSVLENNQRNGDIDRGRIEIKIDRLNDKLDKQNEKMDKMWEIFTQIQGKK